jgi:hypothetical protein
MLSWLSVGLLLAVCDPVAPMPEQEIWRAVNSLVDMKSNPRGPYDGIFWHCRDGVVLPPKSYLCKNHGGGLQYGVLGRSARALGERGIYVGTILASLKPEELSEQDYYRARALIVERYLERALDGWVLRAAKSYRGFRQIEDEREAARQLFVELLRQPTLVNERRYLAVRLLRALPLSENSSVADEIRALAGAIGDAEPGFAELRFKIHAMPEPADAVAVEKYATTAVEPFATQARDLVAKMRRHYNPATLRDRLKAIRRWTEDPALQSAIDGFVNADNRDVLRWLEMGAKLVEAAEASLAGDDTPAAGERRLHALHAMALVEEMWMGAAANLSRTSLTRRQAIQVTAQLARAGQRWGLFSARERESADRALETMASGRAVDYTAGLDRVRRLLEWGRARVVADVGLPLARYQLLEPRAAGVVDDTLRSSVLLPLSTVLDRLTADADKLAGGGYVLFGAEGQSAGGVRGENPGFATGPLRIIKAEGNTAGLRRNEIVLLTQLPSDLPPVAGIITVGAVASLSHVSLLARNLGIPHASVSGALAAMMEGWAGREVVLGVSPQRRVALGLRDAVPAPQRQLVEMQQKPGRRELRIDPKRLDLETRRILSLAEVTPEDAGIRVGPKAAELAHLKHLFPDRVSGAVILPFGVFVSHVDRPASDGTPSPLARMRSAYGWAKNLPPEEGEALVLAELAHLREAIASLPFPPGLEAEIDAGLATLGKPGTFGVFVRSDTNVEDIKDFTGAGLNLTVPNQVRRDDILAAIRAVWASPFSERSYHWRQSLLANPEHVYPSVILHRTVPSEISGVLATTDLETGSSDSITISASEGVSAVVDGGAPETLILKDDGTLRLLASPRSITRKVVPEPPAQGTLMLPASGRDPLLDVAAIGELGELARQVKQRMPSAQDLPWDIEFGLVADRAYLLQIRPLKAARARHPFLIDLDREAKKGASTIDLEVAIP